MYSVQQQIFFSPPHICTTNVLVFTVLSVREPYQKSALGVALANQKLAPGVAPANQKSALGVAPANQKSAPTLKILLSSQGAFNKKYWNSETNNE